MSQKAIRPALGRIILKNVTGDEKVGSIYLPYGKEKLGHIAEVVAICEPYDNGPDGSSGPMYEMGDLVIIGKYNGVDVQVGRENLIVMRESDILAKVIDLEVEDASASDR